MSAPGVLFYVQHLLGIGHQKRAATLSRALCRAGFRVTFVSGGFDVPGLDIGDVEFAQLPPTRAVDKFFKVLVDEHDRPIDDAWKARRRDLLDRLFERVAPDVVLIEMYPFGRRQLRFELEPLLDRAIARDRRPLIASSVRDILVEPDKPSRIDEMIARVERYFDLILVHGDPALVAFDATFPRIGRIADRIRYTGYVVDHPPPPDGGDGTGEVLVSTGGGAVSEQLIAAALAARPLTPLREAPWRVLVGHNLPEDRFDSVRAAAAPGVVVERARPDFTQLVANCTLSISQGGYNTLMEVLGAGRRCVAVPYAGGHETEQTLRCRLLAERGVLQMVEEGGLDGAGMATAVQAALDAPPSSLDGIDGDGASTSAALLFEAVTARTGPAAPAGRVAPVHGSRIG